jgi:hypothetical protein
MREAGFPEMHLVVDAAGQQVKVFPVDFLHRCCCGYLIRYLFYPPVFDQQIANEPASFIHYRNILYQVILHILDRNRKQLTWCNLLKPLQGI